MVPVNLLDMFWGGGGRIPEWKVATEIVVGQTFGAPRGYRAVVARFTLQIKNKTVPGRPGRRNVSV